MLSIATRGLVLAFTLALSTNGAIGQNKPTENKQLSIFTMPDCEPSGSTPAGVYCNSLQDWQKTFEANLPLARTIEEVLVRSDVTSIDGASYFVREALLQALTKAYDLSAAPIRFTTDAGSATAMHTRFVARFGLADTNTDLAVFPTGQPNNPEDESAPDYVFHPKILFVEYAGGVSYGIIFTSDNFKISTEFISDPSNNQNTANFENYNFVVASPKAALVQRHRCFFDALHGRSTGEAFDLRSVGATYSLCLFHRNATHNVADPVRFYTLPFEIDTIIAELAYEAGSATQIDVAGYNAGSPCISTILRKALSNGKRVRIITDDDVCGTNLSRKDKHWYAELENAGAEIRYMQTNAAGALSHRFHHKFMVFLGSGTPSVLTGSANFTCGGFGGNVEAVYLLNQPKMTSTYRSSFEHYWSDLAKPAGEIPLCGN
ncbi:hypothetical protein DC522_03125 [Microvirga sp. KLBC 81]|uniref:phospholipase D family protein n=1 Tax=Microvirga sp. KLBC 81 TaxID=1862707 RepID=UPI000D51BB5E|nr:phospholipase D family protein [Microvirga sp. KLBC 81]PVE25779.1 hypothetical protein DC522_03125 [Microvirga sp. KLBC 81]